MRFTQRKRKFKYYYHFGGGEKTGRPFTGRFYNKDGVEVPGMLAFPERTFDGPDVATRKVYRKTPKWTKAEKKYILENVANGLMVDATKKKARVNYATGRSQKLVSKGRLLVTPIATITSLEDTNITIENPDFLLGQILASDYACDIHYNGVVYPSFIHALSAARWDYIEPTNPQLTKQMQESLLSLNAKAARALGTLQKMKSNKVVPSPLWRQNVCGIARELISQKAIQPKVHHVLEIAARLNLQILVLSPPEDLSWGVKVPKSLKQKIQGRNEMGLMWQREVGLLLESPNNSS